VASDQGASRFDPATGHYFSLFSPFAPVQNSCRQRYLAKNEERPLLRSGFRFPNFPISDFSFWFGQTTPVGRFHGQAVLQRRVLDGTSAEIDRPS
jgi:hypothetical protein